MKTFLLVLGLIVALCIDTAASYFFSIRGVTPTLLLLIVLFASVTRGMRAALFFIFGGFVLNLFSGIFFGLIPLGFLFVSALTEPVVKRFFHEKSKFVFMLIAAIGTLIYYVVICALQYGLFLAKLDPSQLTIDADLVINVLIASLLQGIGGLLLYPLLEWYFHTVSSYGKQQLGTIKRYM